MAELLLELFSEEIPAGAQTKAVEDFKRLFSAKFESAGIVFSSVECYTTPRRVAIVVDGLPLAQAASSEERRGPRVDAPTQAIDGFLKSTGLSLEQLEKRATPKGDFYFAVIKQDGRATSQFLVEAVNEIISTYTWPKSMKWGANQIRWIRPLHSIICLFNGEVLPVSFGHIIAGNKTRGHRFLSSGEFSVANFADYESKLRQNNVVLKQEERKRIIRDDIIKLAATVDSSIKQDEGLLAEVANLVEWPVALLGKIEEKFMSVPQEVLILTMRTNQKYFSLLGQNGQLAPYFITVSNIVSNDGGKQIIHGNGRVLRARLEDAKFFWEQDRKNTLESRVPALEKVVFHARLGTVADKVQRIIRLAQEIAAYVPSADAKLAARAARLCKADLATGTVGEFPELQGLMGSYYALHDKESPEVAEAIKQHYSPVGSSDSCPTAPVSAVVAIADKIDTLVGLFAIDEKPTGSRDPYALRRAALGVIRIILENNLRISLRELFGKSINSYKNNSLIIDSSVLDSLIDFFVDRLRVSLKDQNIRPDIIEAVAAGEDDLTRMVTRAKALSGFLQTEDGINLLAAYKRAINIVQIEEKKDSTSYKGLPAESLLKDEPEKEIFRLFNGLRPIVLEGLKKEQFANVMQELARLRKPVDAFFDNVKVNDDNADIRKNRLLLLAQFREFLNDVADFSKIEG